LTQFTTKIIEKHVENNARHYVYLASISKPAASWCLWWSVL